MIIISTKNLAPGVMRQFTQMAVPVMRVDGNELVEWYETLNRDDLLAIEGFLIAATDQTGKIARAITRCQWRPLIAFTLNPDVNEVTSLLDAGFDDVLTTPLQPLEVMARVRAISRRSHKSPNQSSPCDRLPAAGPRVPALRIFSDGRDPEIHGQPVPLRRREQRVLEFLAANAGRRLTRSQIFSAVYGLCNVAVNEATVESHVSNLRRQLRRQLGYDPIDSKRFLGYRLSNTNA